MGTRDQPDGRQTNAQEYVHVEAWVRTTLTLTRDEAAQLIADQQQLADRQRRDVGDAPLGTRTVVFRSPIYPEPSPSDDVADESALSDVQTPIPK